MQHIEAPARALSELFLEIEAAGGEILLDCRRIRVWHQSQRADLEIFAAGGDRGKPGRQQQIAKALGRKAGSVRHVDMAPLDGAGMAIEHIKRPYRTCRRTRKPPQRPRAR